MGSPDTLYTQLKRSILFESIYWHVSLPDSANMSFIVNAEVQLC